jgi:hypothetical protein
MTILPDLKRELALAARRLEGQPHGRRRWLRFGGRSLVAIPILVGALGGLSFAATQTFKSSHHRHHRPFAENQYRYGHCPTHVVSLGPDALAEAMRAAVRQAHLAYPHRTLKGIYAVDAHVVTKGSVRSVDAERCGLLGKTMLVDLHLPAPFNSASLSQGAVYVSRIQPPGRPPFYQLWGLEH